MLDLNLSSLQISSLLCYKEFVFKHKAGGRKAFYLSWLKIQRCTRWRGRGGGGKEDSEINSFWCVCVCGNRGMINNSCYAVCLMTVLAEKGLERIVKSEHICDFSPKKKLLHFHSINTDIHITCLFSASYIPSANCCLKHLGLKKRLKKQPENTEAAPDNSLREKADG